MDYKGKVSFARLEKHSDFSNKGTGLGIWLKEKQLNDYAVINVGDQDYGVVNDTLVKSILPHGNFMVRVKY